MFMKSYKPFFNLVLKLDTTCIQKKDTSFIYVTRHIYPSSRNIYAQTWWPFMIDATAACFHVRTATLHENMNMKYMISIDIYDRITYDGYKAMIYNEICR